MRSPSASIAAGALVGGIGIVSLAIRVLTPGAGSVPSGAFTLRSTSAVAFILMGLATVLLAWPRAFAWARALRRAAAAAVLVTAALTLLGYAANVRLGIDDALMYDLAPGLVSPMAPVSALGFATSAAAFLLLDVGRAGVLAQLLALATGLLGFLSVVGHAASLQGVSRYALITIPSAFGLLVLSVGILLARADRGLMRLAAADSPAGVVVRRLLPFVIGTPLVIGWLVGLGRRANLYGPELGMAVFLVATVVVLSWLVWSAAVALQRAEVRRRRAERARQRADAEVGRAVAYTAALTDTNKALVETTARLRTLGRLNRLVSSSLEFEAVLTAIARAAADIMATPVVSFWVVDEATRTVSVRAWSDETVGADFPAATFAFGEGLVGAVAARREPLYVPDVFAESGMLRARAWCDRHGLRSFYGVPVLAQDRLLAVLVLSARAPHRATPEDQELLASFVAQAAVSIENARLFADAETRRRAAERAEMLYRELFDRNLAGIIRTTPEGRIVDCNDAMVRILGYGSREAVLALRDQDLYADPGDRQRDVAPLQAGGRLSNAEFLWRRADGSDVAVLVNIAAIQRDDSAMILEGIVVDIADRERAAAAEREAEALRAVTKLANAAAHEINNPLAVIVAHLDLLEKRHGDDPDVIHRIGHARTACRRITEMIEHMGRITRLEVSEQPGHLPPILDLRRSSDPSEPARPVTPS